MYIKTLFSGLVLGLVMFFMRGSSDVWVYAACIAVAAVLLYFWVFDFVKSAKKLRATGLTVLLMIPLLFVAQYLSSGFWSILSGVKGLSEPQSIAAWNAFVTGALLFGVLWLLMSVFTANKLKFVK